MKTLLPQKFELGTEWRYLAKSNALTCKAPEQQSVLVFWVTQGDGEFVQTHMLPPTHTGKTPPRDCFQIGWQP